MGWPGARTGQLSSVVERLDEECETAQPSEIKLNGTVHGALISISPLNQIRSEVAFNLGAGGGELIRIGVMPAQQV